MLLNNSKTVGAGVTPQNIPSHGLGAAPQGRYWIAANAKDVDCLGCHLPKDEVSGTFFEHERLYVRCLLCAQNCLLAPGDRGRCRARINDNGVLRSLVYGRPVSVHIDPIEKKPLYHFMPGTAAFSLATAGCPLSCQFCQNWEISQAKPEDFEGAYVPPEALVAAADGRQVPIIAFTYNEPTVFTEYMIDIAVKAKSEGIRSVLISCGYMNPEPLNDMCQALDAIKVDLKGFDHTFYRDICKAELDPVLRSIQHIAQQGVHLEIVNLVVPTLNDSQAMLKDLIQWVLDEVGPDVPIHFTRFHPDYKMLNLPPTPVGTLEKAYEMARAAGIRYPFVGNVPGHQGNHTYCPECGKAVISRTGFFVTEMQIRKGLCRYCQTPIAGVWT
jgi:pyruvate formate lyase activating enzyme